MMHLFTVTLAHNYFANKRLDYTAFIPSQKTLEIIQRHKLILKVDSGELSLYSLQNVSRKQFLSVVSDMMDNDPLQFTLDYGGPNIVTISQFPVNWAGHLELTSQLHSDQLTLQFNSSSLNETSYIGQINISWESLENNAHFSITIPERQTYWRYYIFNKNNIRFKHPEVLSTDGFIFNYHGYTHLENGEKAMLFQSESSKLSLKEKNNIQLSLVDKRSNSTTAISENKTIINRLPSPKVSGLNVAIEGKDVHEYSDIYVYI